MARFDRWTIDYPTGSLAAVAVLGLMIAVALADLFHMLSIV
jgi:hypothetical protein